MWLPSLHRACRRRVFRGLLCSLVLLGQAVSAIGYQSFAATSKGKDKHCACPLPEQVFGSCCCISSHEEPAEPVAPEPATPSCCLKRAQRSCCDDASKHATETKTVPHGLRWLARLSAAHCQGDEPMGLIAAEPVISERTIAKVLLIDASCESLSFDADLTISYPLDPPVPPPR